MGEDDKAGSGPLAVLRGLLQRPLASYYLLISSSALLLIIGLTMVFSATSVKAYATNGNAFTMITKQAVFAAIGLVAFWACQRLPARTFRALGKPVLGVAIVLLVVLDLLVVYGRMADIDNPRFGPIHADLLWLWLGPIQVQPSELAKFGLVMWGADLLVRKGEALGWWRELATPLFPVVALLFVLVGYNDLGTMLCLLAVVVGLLWAVGVRLRVFATLTVLGLAGIGLLIAAASVGGGSSGEDSSNYRFERITSWVSPPEDCQQGPCYQAVQARYAIDHGGWFGVGLGKSSLKWGYLPAEHNDFIFAVLAEELGVVGSVVVLALFAVLAYTGLRIARRVEDPFRRLAAAAVTTWLVSQAIINIGGVVGLLPITGLPLPFISDGGSALVVTLAAVGMLASFARAEPDAARALHARPPAKWVRLLWAPLPPLPPAAKPAAKPAAAKPATKAAAARTGAESERRR
ncbi:FtsW/RodA/SpoVE family cell cycle protein [Phytohabitans kaempferiae]|uniref:Probable peptidoglycan glycosyltransferase FtsW n=1 Tax=Phytohabitans kaempferiae TaxID=1620943 RepID=A0ABV6M2E9_9ACTN